MVEEFLLHRLELVLVVLADEVAGLAGGGVPFDGDEMEEAFVAFGHLGPAGNPEREIELLEEGESIDELALGFARMDGESFDPDFGMGGVEVLVLDEVGIGPVDRVGVFGPEAFVVEVLGPAADFLVGGEEDAHRVVGDAFLDQFLEGVHDDGKSGLVVAAEEGRAIGRDDGVAHVVLEAREVGDRSDEATRKDDVFPIVVLVDDRVHVLARGFRGGVDMGVEADALPAILSVEMGVEAAVLVDGGILEPEGQ